MPRLMQAILDRLPQTGFRYRCYAVLALGLFVLAVGALLIKTNVPGKERFNFVVSDGRGYYVYLPSLVIDGDLDFRNEIKEHWGPDFQPFLLKQKTERGLVKNRCYVGLAITLTPSFLGAHAVSSGLYTATQNALFEPDGYSIIYQLLNALFLMLLGLGALILMDRLLVEHFQIDARATAGAVVAYWLGSNFLYYYFREPFMAHLVSTFWVVLAIYLVRLVAVALDAKRLTWWHLPALGFATSMALICRPTNAFLFPFFVYLAWKTIRTGMLVEALRKLPWAALGLAPLFVQMLIWQQMTGRWVHNSYDDFGFNWSEPKLWQTLFSSRHGLFLWSPLLLIAAGGLIGHYWQRGWRDPFLGCYLLGAGILWYLNSAWHFWWAGDSFGHRGFIELSGLFILGLALAFQALRSTRPKVQMAFTCLVLGCGLFNLVLMGLYITHRIPRGDYLF